MTTDVDEKPLISTSALVERWGIDRKTILGAIADGKIPCTKVGRRWLIPLAWVQAQEDKQPAPAEPDNEA
jgi:excisionase family DNA binding protein